MFISKLEIVGFKSFPDKTVLDFDNGITGVVGPNGCGKSNILDSIRWVLGEQRTTVLRSAKMEEIIFSGTSKLKPIGMAEVSLTIKNNRGILPLEYDDVVITRRLYRSGESEYLLNKSKCRLKDINELFYDTGMGPQAYSTIQQGMIDAILSDKTEDRRSLFEEAAGVTKYKRRKKDAENKLQATESDLLRLGDIVAEIEKQVVTLRRQAKRAKKYADRNDILKEIEIKIAAATLFESDEKYKFLSDTKQQLKIDVEAQASGLDSAELKYQELRLELSEKEHTASEKRQVEANLSLQAAESESEIKLNKQKSDSSVVTIDDSRKRIAELENRIKSVKAEVESKKSELDKIHGQSGESQKKAVMLEEQLAGISEELTSKESEYEAKRLSHSQIAEKISSINGEISSLEGLISNLRLKSDNAKKSAEGLSSHKVENKTDISNLEERYSNISVKINTLSENQQINENDIASVSSEISQIKEKLSNYRADQSGLNARRELFEQMIETGEGYSGGAKSLISWPEKPKGMMIPLAEALEVPEQYRVAVSVVLGDMGELIPVENYSVAETAIDYLKNNGGGRAKFIPLNKLSNHDITKPNGASGFIGFADDLLKYPEEYKQIVKMLLGGVAVFNSREDAIKVNGDWERITRVTLDGFVMNPLGIISGGKAGSGVIGRRQDLNEINETLANLDKEINNSETVEKQKQEQLAVLTGKQSENKSEISRLEDDKNRINADLSQLKFDFQEKEHRYSVAVNESEQLKRDIELYTTRIGSLRDELNKLTVDLNSSEETVINSSNIVNTAEKQVREIESNLNKARIKNVEYDGLNARIQSEINHGLEIIEEAQSLILRNTDNINNAESTIENSGIENEKIKSSLETIFTDREKLKNELRKIDGEINELSSGFKSFEDEVSSKRKYKEQKLEELHKLDVEFIEIESNRNTIIDRLRMEFSISNIEPKALVEEENIRELSDKTNSIRDEMKRMEPVNLLAAEDYDRENDRLNFLLRQRDDLLEAKSSLVEAITKINITAEERFSETFETIKNNFQYVFETLFEGGEAHVRLEDPSDPLESPIKILARPGGKKMLNVAQLSGGERALTAISLLFSIYLVKPSPFCILDEVDAPLDDVNLGRFLNLIKNFSENTQFIIITHNKLSMEASDVLYGVTMEQPGVSRVVSVKFGENGNGNGNKFIG